MKFITLHFNLKLFFCLVIAFILCTAVGTVSHEAGHCAAAKYYGRNPELSYAYMIPGNPAWIQEHRREFDKIKWKNLPGSSSEEREEFKEFKKNYFKKFEREEFFITLGGPLQTMLTGLVGFGILFYRRKVIFSRAYLRLTEWIAVFLSYFWSRQVFNFIFSINTTFSDRKYFRSDEPRLSQHLHLPPWVFGMITCTFGGLILLWVTFKVIPIKQRTTFLLSGVSGSAIGWIVWMDWLGPIVLP